MLNLKFNSSKELLPRNGQNIVYLKQSSSFGYDGYALASAEVSYMQSDEDGTFWEFDDPGDGLLHVYIGNVDAAQDNVWWIDEEDYWKQFDIAEGELKC